MKTVLSGNSGSSHKTNGSGFRNSANISRVSVPQVVLAEISTANKQYAVKVLDKRHIIKEKKVKYVNIEKHAEPFE